MVVHFLIIYMFLIHLRFLQIFIDLFNNDLGGPYAFLEV